MATKTIKYQGQVYEMPWDKPGNPTKEEALAFVRSQNEPDKVSPKKLSDLVAGTTPDDRGLFTRLMDDYIFKTPELISDFTRRMDEEKINQSQGGGIIDKVVPYMSGFVRGSVDAMATPGDIILNLAGLKAVRGAKALSTLARILEGSLSGALAARGTGRMIEAENPGEVGIGAVQALLGTAGVVGNLPARRAIPKPGPLHGPVPPVVPVDAITDPARMLPSSTGAETPLTTPERVFTAGQAGIADPSMGYFHIESSPGGANRIIPISDQIAAERGLEPLAPPIDLPPNPDVGLMFHDTSVPPSELPLTQPVVTTPNNILANAASQGIPPVEFGDLRHGLRRTQDIPYGLQTTVPNAVREPGMNQAVFEALVPPDLGQRTRYGPRPTNVVPFREVPSVNAPEVPQPRMQTSSPNTEAALNEANRIRQELAKRRAAKANAKPANPPEVAVDTIDKVRESGGIVPPDKEAEVIQKIKQSWFRDVYDRIGTSVLTQLKGGLLSKEISRPLANLLTSTRTEANRLGGHYANIIRQASKGLSKEENLLAYRILDGTAQISDVTPGNVKVAVAKIRRVTEELGDLAETSGIHIKIGPGESVPFKKMEGPYAHHTYPSDFFADEESLITRLIESGRTPEEARKIVENSRTFGERFISPTHAREFNVPGYIEDLGVMEKYAYDMAERITQARNFGAKDIADPASPISQLIARSGNPEKANRLVTEYLNRGTKAHTNIQKAAQAIVRFEVLSHLSLSGINQLADLAGVPVRTGFVNFAKGIGETIKDYEKAVGKATETGALAIMKKEILKDVSQGKFESFAYGLSKAEEVVRTVSAMSGRAAVQDLFGRLQRNPGNTRLKKELGRLLDGNIDEILKQKELTAEQINSAAGRTVELVNSIPDKLSLPPAFTYYNPLVRIPLLFKRFAFTTTSNLSKAILEDPRRLIPAIISYGLAGEAVGDVKAAITGAAQGAVSGDIQDKIIEAVANRDEKSPFDFGHPVMNRAVANLMQSWFLGIFGDMAEAGSRGWRGAAGFAAGPVGSDAFEAVDVINQGVRGNINPAVRGAARRVPFIGPGLSEALRPERKRGGI